MFADMIPRIFVRWTSAPPLLRRGLVHVDPLQELFVTVLRILFLRRFAMLDIFCDKTVIPIINSNLKVRYQFGFNGSSRFRC